MDYLPVLVATLAAFAVGALWYGPLFGRRWRLLMNFSEGHMGASEGAATGQGMGMASAMVGGFIATFFLVWTLNFLLKAFSVVTLSGALALSLLVSIGFIATTLANSVFYERRPWGLYLINLGHYVVALIVAALVLLYT
ncbi:hypothetical protein A2704_06780 [Candidatus Kaiserbacteria bacterium RIFCSPHIGHO2_01_FULL_54_36b]|uniref:DUF1761 domain-containing protein n=1 Tax=Candidatus Kaiserbacteria bacterium RIFCSPHIGHO2_01_FULL_54_36b TaxID=1798483 RepID=A0A1F6CSN3_9BACT|nr:MAG: hypothetical protein A2704_06780 [Candidatus Kaiserbacteria bacterium RIFCSPHIGHO2_01_FULL_54_36b]